MQFFKLKYYLTNLGGALLLASPLDYENQPHFFVQIAASDQGEPPRQAITKVKINVIDAGKFILFFVFFN